MRVLLTGASGFVGRHVLAELERRGIDTVLLGRRAVGSAPLLEADLLAVPDFAPLVQAAGATHLLHLAWYAEHGAYWHSPLNLRWLDATVRLTEAFCDAGGRKAVLAGTCAEYDWNEGYCRERTGTLAPATLYGVAKDATRRLTQAVCAQRQVGFAWARIFLPFGAGEDSRRLLPSLAAVFRGERPAFGVDHLAWRDFVHVADVAEALAAMLEEGVDGPVNIASGQPRQLGEVVRALAAAHGRSPAAVLDLSAPRAGEPRLLVGDNGALSAAGWQARRTLDAYLASGARG
jgi:nucleoside-diphosphate-sugar epimerase